MKTIYIIIAVIGVILTCLGFYGYSIFKGSSTYSPSPSPIDFYSLKCNTLSGDEFSFESLRGKNVLLVNTASACGFTPQYKALQQLHLEMGDHLTILGFPCNDFGAQEQGSHDDISLFCSKNYGVTFQMMEKITIKGEGAHPVYVWLKSKNNNGVADHSVRWNFHKFLVDEAGSLIGSFKSGVDPMDNQILSLVKDEK